MLNFAFKGGKFHSPRVQCISFRILPTFPWLLFQPCAALVPTLSLLGDSGSLK